MPMLWTVILGDWDRAVDEQGEQRIPVENIFVHERFNNYNNDIALLQLSRPACNRSQPLVCLDPPSSPPRLCVATGWGRASSTGPLSSVLRQVRVPILDNQVCREKYRPVVNIESGHLCAGRLDGSVGACVVSTCSFKPL
ncbi:hypothetical protein J6590_091564 [Homalodisca vitripennis]|nr:hypothetical protein J6590_091564 [Homalodisca vitripennis]